jgi:phenylpyruvate tautomerase PptA (4-oxalocrotonate tautomerase family)
MPLIRVEIREGWSHPEKARLLDAIPAVAVEALRIPDDDRTQILTEHPAEACPHRPPRGLAGESGIRGGTPASEADLGFEVGV